MYKLTVENKAGVWTSIYGRWADAVKMFKIVEKTKAKVTIARW